MCGPLADRNESRRESEQQGTRRGHMKIELERKHLVVGMLFVFLAGIFFGYLLATF